jgi:hypothetical protein
MDLETALEYARAWQEEATTGMDLDSAVRALMRLPEPEAWAISGDVLNLFFSLCNRVVFTVFLNPHGGSVTKRYAFDPARVSIELLHDAPMRTTDGLEWETHWAFRYPNETLERGPWQDLRGKVKSGGHDPDQREEFARALAAVAGWAF